MSGGGGGVKTLGVVGAVAGVALAPFTGGLSLGLIPGSLAIASTGNRMQKTENRVIANQRDSLLGSLNKPVTALPSMNSNAVQSQRINSLRSLQQRSGRASTLLTTQSPVKNTFG